jgi:hypothetical protein
VGLEGCPYAKKYKPKAVRMLHDPDRFWFVWLFLIFFWLTP